MKIEVLLFARLREAIGTDQMTVDVEPGITVSQLAAEVVTKHGGADVASLPLRCAVAETLVADDHLLCEGDQVVILTPMCGG